MKSKIRTLVFLGFTAVGLTSAGCVVDNTSPPSCANPISLSWHIADAAGPLRCEDVPAGFVHVTAGGVVTQFSCTQYAGSTLDMPGGQYAITTQLIAPDDQTVLSEADETWTVPTCGGLDIGDVGFLVN
jgi:hypothetical protein